MTLVFRKLPFWAIATLVIAPTMVFADFPRTWVSSNGSDANTGAQGSPCRTIGHAMSVTSVGGEVVVQDPGEYGNFAIGKSITIDGGGFISVVDSVVVDAGPSDTVILRNLKVDGAGTQQKYGIRVGSVGSLHIENCTVTNHLESGLYVNQPLYNSRIFVTDSTFRGNTIAPTGAGLFFRPLNHSLRASLTRVTVEKYRHGLRAEDNATVNARDCIFTENDAHGVFSFPQGTGPTNVLLDRCTMISNGFGGVRSANPGSTIRIGDSSVINNLVGYDVQTGGNILSFSSNQVLGNTTNGSPTGTITLK